MPNVAHLVERFRGKEEVAGSNPVVGSRLKAILKRESYWRGMEGGPLLRRTSHPDRSPGVTGRRRAILY